MLIYQAPACRYRRTKEGSPTCRDRRCEACFGPEAGRVHCSAGRGGPFQCELEEDHVGSHLSTIKWDDGD